MSQLSYLLKQKEAELQKILKKAEDSLKDAPAGSLRINSYNGRVQYYHRLGDPGEEFKFRRNGHFICKKNEALAKALAQKRYDEKVRRIAEKELAAIQKLSKIYDAEELKTIYTQMEEERKKLVTPIILPDEEFVKRWEEETSDRKNEYPIRGDIYTEKGEHVRSKSEKILADKFAMMGIPYKYEQEVVLSTGERIYPDFVLLNIRKREEVYYEHFGMMDDPEYQENALHKILLYEKNGLWVGKNLLCSFETKRMPLNIRLVEKKIKELFLG